MRLHRLAALFAAGALLHAAPAAAQFRIDLQPGTRVRLTTAFEPAEQVKGSVVRTEGNGATLMIQARVKGLPAGRETSYRLQDLASIEVRGGRNRARGALLGSAIATGFSALFGTIDYARGEISSGELTSTVVSNSVVGALLGYAFAPRGWLELPLPHATNP
jgi:hypothetical protein